MKFVNSDNHARWWPTICRADLSTLELEPGEEAEDLSVWVNLPAKEDEEGVLREQPAIRVPLDEKYVDPYLKPVVEKPSKGATQSAPADEAAPEKE